MGIVHHLIFIVRHPAGDIKQCLIAICFHEEFGEAQHAIAWRRPNTTTLALQNLLLLRRQPIVWFKIVNERVLDSELNSTAEEPKLAAASKQVFVASGKRYPER